MNARPEPPPDRVGVATFVVREALAICFVGVWLLLLVGEIVTGAYNVPFWVDCLGVGVMAYALGVSVGELTAYRKPSATKVIRQRREDQVR